MNGICLIGSRGRLISPSMPVGDDMYLNLSSQKRPTGRNPRGNRLVRRSGSTSRGTVVLVFRLRMRTFPEILGGCRVRKTTGSVVLFCKAWRSGRPQSSILLLSFVLKSLHFLVKH